MTMCALAICLTIEVLNVRAGNYLPRQDFPIEGNPKWRTAAIPRGPADIANARLKWAVQNFGLLQYPLTYALLLELAIAFRCRAGRWRPFLGGAILVNLLCITLMHYRGYFTSLGW